MFFNYYNIPEGFEYDFEGVEKSTTYKSRYDFLMRCMNNKDIVYAKVIGYADEGKTLYLDLGCGILGVCYDNWISDEKNYWLNKYLVGNIVNVKIDNYEDEQFVCSRTILQEEAFENQKELYVKGTKVLAKIISHNDKIVILDIGGGNITYTYVTMFKYFDFNDKYVNIVIKNYSEKKNNFWFEIDNSLCKAQVISKVQDGYLVSIVDKPGKHTVMKTDEELKVGSIVMMEKNVVVTTTYKYYPSKY